MDTEELYRRFIGALSDLAQGSITASNNFDISIPNNNKFRIRNLTDTTNDVLELWHDGTRPWINAVSGSLFLAIQGSLVANGSSASVDTGTNNWWNARNIGCRVIQSTTTFLQFNLNSSTPVMYIGETSLNRPTGATGVYLNAPDLIGTKNLVPYSGSNLIIGTGAALATSATSGFLQVPTCAGTPTGTATNGAMIVDTTNNKLYFYSGSAWRDAGP